MGNPVQKYDDVRWLYLNRAASNRRGEEEGKEKKPRSCIVFFRYTKHTRSH